ncbi:MAG: acetate kinase [Aeromonadaceae bacterium]|nr:acetate kinase [Aeromonadaceae bacterium]
MDKTFEQAVLVLNCGSSSLKFAVVDPATGEQHLTGLAEALGLPEAEISWRFGRADKQKSPLASGADHTQALQFLEEVVFKGQEAMTQALVAVGHRVVHGGELFSQPELITDEVEAGIEKCIPFAPLHNPAHLLGIRAARRLFSHLPHVAIFDTAFHQTMPPASFMYAIPNKLYKEHGMRRYGAHGTSHFYVAGEAAKLLGKPAEEVNVITAHLGNGGSLCAVKGGKSIDTSMGITPLEGLMMGTRCGNVDPSLVFFMVDELGYSLDQVKDVLNKQSGLLGISGKTSDFRGITQGLEEGDEQCALAFDMFCYRLAKFIASYYVPLGRVDALVFTGGIGENSLVMRSKVLSLLAGFGYQEDTQANEVARFGQGGLITAEGSAKAFVIPTNEELVIARGAAAFAG